MTGLLMTSLTRIDTVLLVMSSVTFSPNCYASITGSFSEVVGKDTCAEALHTGPFEDYARSRAAQHV